MLICNVEWQRCAYKRRLAENSEDNPHVFEAASATDVFGAMVLGMTALPIRSM